MEYTFSTTGWTSPGRRGLPATQSGATGPSRYSNIPGTARPARSSPLQPACFRSCAPTPAEAGYYKRFASTESSGSTTMREVLVQQAENVQRRSQKLFGKTFTGCASMLPSWQKQPPFGFFATTRRSAASTKAVRDQCEPILQVDGVPSVGAEPHHNGETRSACTC